MNALPDTPTEHLDQYTHYCNQDELRRVSYQDELIPKMAMPFTEESLVDYFVLVDTANLPGDEGIFPDEETRFVLHSGNDEGFLFYCQGYYEWDDDQEIWILCMGVVFSPEWSSGFVFWDPTSGGLQPPPKAQNLDLP